MTKAIKQTAKDAPLRTKSSRRNISDDDTRKLHVVKLFKGLALGYRKGVKGGSWIARRHEGGTKYGFEPLGIADDASDADGIRVLTFDQAQEAARKWFKRKAESDAGVSVIERYTVKQAMEDYVTDRERTKRKKLHRTRTLIAAHIVPAFGEIDVAKLTLLKVKAWRDGLATAAPRLRSRPGKPQAYRSFDSTDPDAVRMRQATANRILTVLKAGLNHAHEHERIASKAAWEAVKPYRRVDLPKIRFLTAEEVTILIPACEDSFQKLVKAALLTGCRYGELTAMKVEAFDAAQERVYVADSKNGESRYVDLNGEGVALFAEVTKGRNGKETIFLRSNGKAWKSSEQKRPMDAACEVAKLEGVTFHILRHTYASHAVMNGMPIAVLSEHLGHKDTRITERHYAHLSQSYKQKLIRANAPSFGFGAGTPGPILVSRAS